MIMGVAGCGKSSLAAAVARAEGLPLVEGDDHHSPASKDKMRRGVALTDDDRAGWLDRLAGELQRHPRGVVMSCSALKRAYRDRLRGAAPHARFVYMDISAGDAMARVAQRAAHHFFSVSLVETQFAALEAPTGEPRVLRVDALVPLDVLQAQVSAWLREETCHE